MRSVKELLELMLERQDKFSSGLCNLVFSLLVDEEITRKEYYLIRHYIQDNKPSIFSSLSAFKSIGSGNYWKRGDIAPRIKWIKKQIEKL